jgi:hypothetical protein
MLEMQWPSPGQPVTHPAGRTSSALACALVGALALAGGSAPARAQQADPPEVLGTLVGATAQYPAQPSVQIYGADLGWTFEHAGELQILFGDTWPYDDFICDPPLDEDDSQGRLEWPWTDRSALPLLTFDTTVANPDVLQPMRLLRDGSPLHMGVGRVAQAGFSDGVDAYGIFSRSSFVECDPAAPTPCPAGLICVTTVGRCTTSADGLPALCNASTGAGCPLLTSCDTSGPGYCMDPTSSQYDGSQESERYAVAHTLELARQRPLEPPTYDSAARFATNKFTNHTVRGVAAFTGTDTGNDYGPGTDTLFIWGRPWFWGEEGRQAQLYLLRHDLPLVPDAGGQVQFVPEYFAGLGAGGQPIFDADPETAVPLALDGASDPAESRAVVNQMTISWVGAPISKWVMLYGGDVADFLLVDPGAIDPAERGPIWIRYADHPWGPWTEPEAHFDPGSPAVVGDAYGPGGVLYHNQCVDQGAELCADSDPTRPLHLFCIPPAEETDIGRFYAPNIIDAYTELEADRAHIYWNLSTWNPYAVVLARTTLRPDAEPDPCGDGVCEAGEDCTSCPADCPSGTTASCGNGVCEAGSGEDCLSCAADCAGKQNGKPSGRFCCGDGDGEGAVGCGDGRCGGAGSCTEAPSAPSCCGDLACTGDEDPFSCSLDCGAPPACGDGTCDAGESTCSCAADCGGPSSEACGDGLDNDCDGATDCSDDDCSGDPLCSSCSGTGADCSSDGECCSGKCKGKSGSQTCR